MTFLGFEKIAPGDRDSAPKVKAPADPPDRLTGSEFEGLVRKECDRLRKDGIAHIGRYGVQAVRTRDEWMVLQSLPDFEGVFGPHARQIIFDCKATSQASFPLDKYRLETRGARSRQLRHMYERDEFGASCWFMIHWNARRLKTKDVDAATYMFPASHSHPFWQAFDAGELKSLRLADCQEYGMPVEWVPSSNSFAARPDLKQVIRRLL